MAEVEIVDAPGGVGEQYQCPNCSRTYSMIDLEDKRPIGPPKACRRCGSPMDIGQGAAYGNTMADEAAGPKAPTARRTVKV